MQISSKVLTVLQAEKISAEELFHMMNELAYTSIRGCNRRYFQWLFRLNDNMLQDMQRLDLVEVGRGRDRMTEEHEECNGEGCKACGWIGHISRAFEDTTARKLRHASQTLNAAS